MRRFSYTLHCSWFMVMCRITYDDPSIRYGMFMTSLMMCALGMMYRGVERLRASLYRHLLCGVHLLLKIVFMQKNKNIYIHILWEYYEVKSLYVDFISWKYIWNVFEFLIILNKYLEIFVICFFYYNINLVSIKFIWNKQLFAYLYFWHKFI